ncbi:hypothetical protein [Brachymonas denitrificans]|uniref:hypothetical protein n=1 Tax=Brachymonas denitrificans TaxID=28220 RepID=UPI00321FF9F6
MADVEGKLYAFRIYQVFFGGVMGRVLLGCVLLGFSTLAMSAGPWFPIILHNDEVMVVGKGMSIDECTKKQLELEQKAKGAMIRCSKMTQKVRAESKDETLDRAYQFTWVADYVAFTEATSLKQCKKEKAMLAKHGADFFCAESFQLIK